VTKPSSTEAAVEALLCQGLAELGLPGHRAAPLSRLCHLLDAWAQRMSLTGHRTPEAIARRLVLDALALERVLPEAPSLVDLGSGAGFPGLPIAIVRPACRVALVEARERRHHFQRAAVRELGLANVEPLRGRAELLEPQPHAIAIAQAMAEPGQAAAWLLRWVEPGGLVAIPGGADPSHVAKPPGLEEERVAVYRVPLDGPQRTLWLARRPHAEP
jgi:16S rRNA (guanine527-N7)-methyltransferase